MTADDRARAFVRESEEGITDLNNALLALESDPDDAAAMDAVFRTAHTLKGNAAAMGYDEIAGLAHAMEDLLDEVRIGDVAVSGDLMDLLFDAVDRLDAMLGAVAETGDPGVASTGIEEALRSLADDGVPDGEGPGDWSVDGGDDAFDHGVVPGGGKGVYRATVTMGETEMAGVDALFVLNAAAEAFGGPVTDPGREAVENGAFVDSFDCYVRARNAAAVEAELGGVSQVESVTVEMLEPPSGERPDEPEGEGTTDAGTEGSDDGTEGESDEAAESESGAASDAISSVRVDVERLDDLYGLVEQLVTSRIKLRREMDDAGVDSGNLDELDKISSNLQNTVMDMRLIPLSAVVDTFPRVVRDLAREQEKSVAFDLDGSDIELDRTILTEIRDPLVHVLRNAVDHGIEPPAERTAADKPAEGTIELRATRERDHVTIVVEDDGGGIDADAIRAKAVETGVKTPAEAEAMSDGAARDLIFHPGLSTTDEVTDVSGRGVGMDVVRTTVKELDGTVTLDSTPGEGTRIEIRLPVTVAIVRVMFVRVDGVEYGVPIKNIGEVSRARGIDTVHGDEVVRHDGDIYPVVRLSETLHDRGGVAAPAMADGGEAADGSGTAVGAEATDGDEDDGMLLRIHEEKRPVAFHCDEVLHQEEVVVKPLEGVLSGTPGLSGTAVLGDGDVVSILDVETLGGGRR